MAAPACYKPYRNKRTLELLWQGVWTYVREHGADVMIGCASFEGTDPSIHARGAQLPPPDALAPEVGASGRMTVSGST